MFMTTLWGGRSPCLGSDDMNGAFYVGAAGLHSQQRALEVIANNIANMNTLGFKRSEVRFAELMAGPSALAGAVGSTSDGLESLGGVMAQASSPVFVQGDLKPTGRPLDVAINGEGFLELLGQDGSSMLWRGGAMKINADGFLAAANGMPLKTMISVPIDASAVTIDRDGKVSAVMSGDLAAKQIGQLELVRVKDTGSMTSLSDGLFQPANPADLMVAKPGEDGSGVIVQGFVEGSNVQLSDEMVTLLLMQRSYAANAQVLQAGDQLMAIANGLRR